MMSNGSEPDVDKLNQEIERLEAEVANLRRRGDARTIRQLVPKSNSSVSATGSDQVFKVFAKVYGGNGIVQDVLLDRQEVTFTVPAAP